MLRGFATKRKALPKLVAIRTKPTKAIDRHKWTGIHAGFNRYTAANFVARVRVGVPADIKAIMMPIVDGFHDARSRAVATLTIQPCDTKEVGVMDATRIGFALREIGYDARRAEARCSPVACVLRN